MKRYLLPLAGLLLACPVLGQAEPVVSQVAEVAPNFLTEMNGAFYFSAYDTVNGSALWKSDGTRGGTQVVKAFNISGGTESDPRPQRLLNAGGSLYFCAYEAATGWELWKSDGTGAGTSIVKDLKPGADNGVEPHSCHLAAIGSQIFFPGVDAVHGAALWKTDGTAANTVMVQDIQPASVWGLPQYLFVMNNTLFFVGNDAVHGDEWWKSEGPGYSSATMVKDIWTGIFGGVGVDGQRIPVIMNGYFYFDGNEGTNGSELWRSDGTEAGTTLVKNINETPYVINGPGGAYPCEFTLVGSTLFFRAQDDLHGREVWKSDGTPGGTALVKDIYPGTDLNFAPSSLTGVNGSLYFNADDGTNGQELWQSDGSEAGTLMLDDINPGAGASWPRNFILFQGEVYFGADDGSNGEELWKTDGTVGNATLVADIAPGSDSSWPGTPLFFNQALYFQATYDNSVPEGEGDALFRYGEWQSEFYWPMYLSNIINNAKKR